MKTLKLFCLLSLSLLLSDAVLAHASLTSSKPGNEAVVHQAPATLELGFNEKVQLLKLAITNSKGKEVAINFKPTATDQTAYAIPLPALADDMYKAIWTILGDDGHKVTSSLSFTVNATAPEKAGEIPHSHSEHGH